MADAPLEEAITELVVEELGRAGVPKGAKTSDYYRTFNIPARFDNPGGYNSGNPVFTCYQDNQSTPQSQPNTNDWFQHSTKKSHPMYQTTSAEYGSLNPSVHTMPTTFNCKSQEFSEHLGKCGMYRNHSLNTMRDKSKV